MSCGCHDIINPYFIVEVDNVTHQITIVPQEPCGNNINIDFCDVDVIEIIHYGPQGSQGTSGSIGPSGSCTCDTGSFVTTSSFNAFTSSYYTTSASFDFRINNISIDTSSFIRNSQTSSMSVLIAQTASYSFNSISSSYALTASFALNVGNFIQSQSDWTQTNSASVDFIKNKPSVTLPYIDIHFNLVYSATMTGSGSLIEGQVYRVTNIPLFTTGKGITFGYFTAYREPSSSRVYLNGRGYGRLYGTNLTVVASIDWYQATGPQAGNPEFISFEVPEKTQSYFRTPLDYPDDSENALYLFNWGADNCQGAELVNVKLRSWNINNGIKSQKVTSTIIIGNNHTGLTLKNGSLECKTFAFDTDGITIDGPHIDAPTEDFVVDTDYTNGHYITGLGGTITRNLPIADLMTAAKLGVPANSEFVGIFLITGTNNADTIYDIVGGYSKVSPFWIKSTGFDCGVKTFLPTSLGSVDADHNILVIGSLDPGFTFSGWNIETQYVNNGLKFRYGDQKPLTRKECVTVEEAVVII